MMKVNDNTNEIRFWAFISGWISVNMERNLSNYQQLLADLDCLMDGIDTMSSGLLSHTYNSTRYIGRIIRPCKKEIDGTF